MASLSRINVPKDSTIYYSIDSSQNAVLGLRNYTPYTVTFQIWSLRFGKVEVVLERAMTEAYKIGPIASSILNQGPLLAVSAIPVGNAGMMIGQEWLQNLKSSPEQQVQDAMEKLTLSEK